MFHRDKETDCAIHACSFLSYDIVKPSRRTWGIIPVRRLSCSMLPNTDARFLSTETPDVQLFCGTLTFVWVDIPS